MALAEMWSESDRALDGDEFTAPVQLVAVPGLPLTDPLEIATLAAGLLDQLAASDLSSLPDGGVVSLVGAVTSLHAQTTSVAADVAAEVERRGHGRSQGFFSTRGFIEHHAQLSGPTALARTQTMRMFALLPAWAAAARQGLVGVDQTLLMSRVAANPRVTEALVDNIGPLLDDATMLPYDEFERRLRTFERLADPDGAKSANDRAVERRDARFTCERDGSWTLKAQFPSLDGAEANEILAHFIDAEFRSDLDAARGEGVDEPGIHELARTEPQRRADALLAALRAAASSPGPGRRPLPTLNVLIDERTLEAAITGRPIDPAEYASVTCRTQAGDTTDLNDTAALALWAHIRRVVHDGSAVVTELGRRRRLFSGSARDAALMLSMRCEWPGCKRPVRNCEVDHAVSWMRTGATDPDNALCLCKSHNLFKERGRFGAHRDVDGTWTITDPTGRPVGG